MKTWVNGEILNADKMNTLEQSVPASATSSNGVVTFKNGAGTDLFSVEISAPTQNDDSIYILRTLPYTSYLKQLQKIIGGTVAWNNIIASTYTTKTYEGITTTGANGTFTITNNSRTAKYNTGSTQNRVTSTITGLIKSGHKYIVYGESTSDLTGVCVALGSSTVGIPINSIFVPSSSANYLTLRVTKDYDFVTNHPIGDVCTFTMNVTDLTQAFGLTIADYIYALESNTAGAGIAWLKSYGFLSKDYYQYHAATLESVNASAHVMRDAADNIIGNYALDADLQLRGILKLDANNNLYYDGDEYASDGTVTRKYGIRAFQSGDATDGSTMITDGTNTVYELVTPTTETADPYINPQIVDASGTEQYVDASFVAGTRDFEMPVGHDTEYNFVPEDNRLYLCDTATVDASLIGVSATAKCVRVVYNVLTDMYDNVTVGTVQTDIVDTILKLGE